MLNSFMQTVATPVKNPLRDLASALPSTYLVVQARELQRELQLQCVAVLHTAPLPIPNHPAGLSPQRTSPRPHRQAGWMSKEALDGVDRAQGTSLPCQEQRRRHLKFPRHGSCRYLPVPVMA